MGSTAIELVIMPALSGLGFGTLCGASLLALLRAIGSLIGQDEAHRRDISRRLPTGAGPRPITVTVTVTVTVTGSYVITTQAFDRRA